MSQPIIFQRLEGLVAFVGCLILYQLLGYPLLWFFILFFSIDLTLLGYLANPRVGAIVYNLGHSYVLPLLGLGVAYALKQPPVFAFMLIWLAHISFDRAAGYGLKFSDGFGETHLGRIGRSAR